MNRLSSAHTSLGSNTHNVDGMTSKFRTVGGIPSSWLVDLSPLHRWLARGGEVIAWLTARGLPIPHHLYRFQPLGEDAFIVRTGQAEFFLHDGPSGALQDRLGVIPDEVVNGMRIVERDDLEMALQGVGADILMREFCALDLSSAENQFLLTRVARVNSWLSVDKTGSQQHYRIGCDPSYGKYLFKTLLEGIREHGGDLIGYADFYDLRGISYDAN